MRLNRQSKMQVEKVSSSAGYASRLYEQQLDQVRAQQLTDRRQKIKEEEKVVEAYRLNRYNEEQRLKRNELIFQQFKDMELYLFKCRQLQLQENKKRLTKTIQYANQYRSKGRFEESAESSVLYYKIK